MVGVPRRDRAALTAQKPLKGAGLRILTETVSSPTLAAQIRDLLARFPSAKWHQWDPASRDNARAGAQARVRRSTSTRSTASSRPTSSSSLDADFLGSGPAACATRATSPPAGGRNSATRMNRLYAHRDDADDRPARAPTIACRSAQRDRSRRAQRDRVALQVGRDARWAGAAHGSSRASRRGSRPSPRTCRRIADAASSSPATQPPAVHALAHAMNGALGNVGKTVVYTDPVEAEPVDQLESLRELVADMDAGKVDLLVILGGNPVYTAPADLDFADALGKVPAARPSQPARRRDVGAVPLADSRGALPRSLERRARLRRHGRRSSSR